MMDVYGNNAMGMNGGNYNYGGYAPQVKFSNFLTPEQIRSLRQTSQQFSLSLTTEDIMRGVCNHRNETGDADTLVFDPLTGEATCTTCGYKFRPVEPDISIDEIKDNVDRIVDLLQTVKLMYIDLPAEAATEYFPVIPLLEKLPQLFEYAAKNMNKHELNTWNYNNRNMGAMQMFTNLQSMFANGGQFMNQPQMQQPQGMYQQQPMMQPQMGNPFGFPGAGMPQPMMQPQMGYMPQMPGYAYTPNQQSTPVAATIPEAPAVPEEVTVTQNVSV